MPQLSPDGKFYWSRGQWVPMPGASPTLLVVKSAFPPNNGANPPPAIEQSLALQGMDPTRPFSPGRPINPYFGYSVDPRSFDFRTGQNITIRPRSDRFSFETLRDITRGYDIAGMCITRRIDSFRSFTWSIVPMDGDSTNLRAEIAEARRRIAKPDGKLPYRSWIAKYLQSVFRYDAGCLYKKRDRIGRVIGLKVVDGSTIAPMLDEYGDTPDAPAPAYIQFANGVPWDWMTAADMIYLPYYPQPDSAYGWSPMETVLLGGNTDIRMQQGRLQRWTEGSIPGAIAEAPEDMSTPAEVEELQDVWDAKVLADQAKKVQVQWVPHGSNFKPFSDGKFDETEALFLARKTCAAYSVVPQDIGLTMDVNRANGETQVDIQERIADRPLAEHIDGILTAYLQEDCQLPVKMVTSLAAEKEDRKTEAEAWKIYIETGIASADEGRQKLLGYEVDNERPVPRFILNPRTGPIPLASLYNIAGPVDPETAAPTEEIPLDGTQFAGAPAVLPDKLPGDPAFKRAPVNPDDPSFPANEKLLPETGVITPPAQATAPTPPAAAAVAPPATAVRKDANLALQAAGLAVRAADTGRILMMQRSLSAADPASGMWEFPGGHIEGTETAWEAAWREWQEETGCGVPAGQYAGAWTAGIYRGFLWVIPHESDLALNLQQGRCMNPDDPDGDNIEVAAWFNPLEARDMPALRPECRLTDWQLVSGLIPALKAETAGVTVSTGISGIDLQGEDTEEDDDDEDLEEVQKELRRWRSNARSRVKRGKHPRVFASEIIPAEHAAGIWTSLEHASTREEVDAAFSGRPKVRKAASSRPFLKHIEAAEAHFKPRLVDALHLGLDPQQIARRWAAQLKPVAKASGPPTPAMKQAAAAFASGLTTDAADLLAALEAVYGAGYVIGAKEAVDLVRNAGQDVSVSDLSAQADSIDWSKWTPGDQAAANELAGLDGGDGLQSLLDAAGLQIKSIQDTRLGDLAGRLAQSAAAGDDVDVMASKIADLLDDPSQAESIATTELNRAVTTSTLDVYRQNDIGEFNVLVYNPCEICADQESDNPHELDDDAPPYHPRCRCAAAPVIGGTT